MDDYISTVSNANFDKDGVIASNGSPKIEEIQNF